MNDVTLSQADSNNLLSEPVSSKLEWIQRAIRLEVDRKLGRQSW